MAGQVDVIISEKARREIADATVRLETLHRKILQVNKAGAKGGSLGVGGNQASSAQLASLNKLVSANNRLASASNKSLSAINRNTEATRINTRENKKSLGVMKALRGAAGALGLAFVAMKVAQFGKHIFELAKTFDSLRFALERTSKNLNEAGMTMRFMLKTSSDLGLNLVATTTRFIKFAAAARQSGVAMKDTQKIFKTMATAGAVLGLRTDELGGIFLALEQMLSKGKVTTEELRRQLGERLPGAFGIMAASLGVTLPKLDEMLKKGELLSAEVLPGFADAVEVAFGLDTVDKVETLTAAQNRMTTSWQNFVKNVTESDGILSKTFKFFLDQATQAINEWNELLNNQAYMDNKRLSAGFDNETQIIKFQAKKKLEDTRKEGQKLEDLNIKIIESKALLESNVNNKLAEKELSDAVSAKLEYNKILGELEQQGASERFNASFSAVVAGQKLLDDANKRLEGIGKTKSKTTDSEGNFFFTYNKKQQASADEAKEMIEDARRDLQILQGALNATRLLAEKSKPASSKEDDKGKGQKNLNDIKDLEKKIQIERLRNQLEYNKEAIGLERYGSEQRLFLLKKNAEHLESIARLELEDSIQNDKQKRDSKIEAIKKSIIDKTLGEKKGNDQITLLNKEFTQKEKLATLKHDGELIKIQEDLDSEIESERKDGIKRRLQTVQAGFDKEETAANDLFKASQKTTKDRELLEKTLTDIAFRSSNARIDILIEEQKKLLEVDGLSEEYILKIKAIIAKLDASRGVPGSKKIDKTAQEQFESDMGYVKDFSDAIGSIGDAIFDSKIARIDAEIQAEQDKYALLFAFAEGDAEAQRLLAIQQEEDMQRLEAKKRKMQRKQAVFNKAQALVDIAINTAVAISRIVAEGGLFLGLPLVPVIATLGALQAAAVLAQPLPAFAEGGVMGHDGPALVGDGGKQEVIRTPDGKVSLTPATDTVMNLQKGTEIFSSVEKFNQQNPSDMSSMLHSASLLSSISLNQKNIEGMLSSKQELDERLLDAMILNTKAVKNSRSNTYVKTQKIDIPHEVWKSKLLN